MFIGHYAVALAAKKASPRISLGTLFLSTQFLDLLWPIFLLLGLEHFRIDPGNTAVTPLNFYDYPITHSLLGAIVWSCVFGLLCYGIRREFKSASVVALVVFSHWILDFVTHRPDLPLGFGRDIFFGLGLWNSMWGTLIVEVCLYSIGAALYYRTTVAKDRVGAYSFWTLIGILFAIYLANLFGPPPPSVTAVAIGGNAAWLFVLWAYWVNRHRTLRPDNAQEETVNA